MVTKAKRQVNVELLRILSMLCIVMGHYYFYGIKPNHTYFDLTSLTSMIDYCTIEPLWIFSCIGTNCFVMISGYFLINRDSFRWGGLAKIWLQTIFYTLGIFFLFGNFNIKELLTYSFPIHSEVYWFITKFFALTLLAPFLSKLAMSLTKKQYQILLCIMFVLFFEQLYGKLYAGGSSLLWMIFLFLVAGYYKLYGIHPFIQKYSFYLVITLVVVLSLLATGINLLTNDITKFRILSTDYHSFTFFVSFLAFISMTKLEVRNKFWISISKLAPYSLGVYLIHQHPIVNDFIWDHVIPEHYVVPMVIHCVVVSLCIFGGCTLIDYGRNRIFIWLKVDTVCSAFNAYLTKKMI